ncbi:FecR domain-containing protein [Rhodocytophaga aerolata]|uniref:FecR domain-containing protein n=1 Tax=Rhodocytophaga aerolata TaxID=455078 RepID=A0ABT8RDQ5_9BACT|nr:FecR domain-containing protein [Rhodocytophaga aerolata]MDO1450232.1 FecR domain-containing protein [Rhodocytophaga aerolata]
MDYTNYTEEDFILDHSFYNWVFDKNELDTQFWEEWIAFHPQKQEVIQRAKQFLQNLQLKETTFSDQDTAEVWLQIESIVKQPSLEIDRVHSYFPTNQVSFFLGHWHKLAAVFVGILLVSIYVWLQAPPIQIHHTSFGETKTILLPDSSKVTLNANSTLRYQSRWNSAQAREVWLEGEAFLQVVKKPRARDAKFIVHTDKLNVEVLGTAFNVNSRRGKTKVVLNSGKVKLLAGESKKRRGVVMVPGEMVEFSENALSFSRKKVNPDIYSSWRNHKLYFTDNTLQEITQMLEDTYGLKITIQDPLLRNRKLTGEISSTDEQTVLEVLAESLNIRLTRKDRQVIIQSK